LKRPSRRDLELNELRWWSNWARLAWFGSSGYLLTSDELTEPFFNRAGALACAGVNEVAAWAEQKLAARGSDVTITVFDSCHRAASALEASGYKPADTMTVLLSNGPVAAEGTPQAAIVARPSAESWTRAYLGAFYGDQRLASSVTPIVSRLMKVRAATLLEARVGGEAAGVLAIFRTKGLAGVYCVGTVPEHRRRGVAGSLLARAREIAEAEGRELILQSLASDGSERYYLRRGFVALYSKRLLSKENSNAIKSQRV